MKRILQFTMVCLIICLAACSNDEPKQPAVSAIENAVKHLNGKFSCKSVNAGKDVLETLDFSPYDNPIAIGNSKAYGSLRYTSTDNNVSSKTFFYTFSFGFEKLYLELLNDNGSPVARYILSDVNANSFHLRLADMDEDSFNVFIRQ